MIKGNTQSINLGSVEHVYTPQEMEAASKIMPQSGSLIEDFKVTTSEELSRALEERQKFKEENNPFKDYNSNLRKAHRPDLGY